MIAVAISVLAVTAVLVALGGCAYTAFAMIQVARFPTAGAPSRRHLQPEPGVTLLKPLCSAEAGLYTNLRSFCSQDYTGPVQIIFGVARADDPAVGVVDRLRLACPECDIHIVVTGTDRRYANRKVANLAGIARHARHERVIVSDSDIAVPRDYLRTTVGALDRPGVGCVTWLYRGVALDGIWSRLARM